MKKVILLVISFLFILNIFGQTNPRYIYGHYSIDTITTQIIKGTNLVFKSSNITRLTIAGANVTWTLGSDATGDIWYRNASGYMTRLGVGTNGQVLTLSSGLPSWQDASGGTYTFTSPITESAGTVTLGGSQSADITINGTGSYSFIFSNFAPSTTGFQVQFSNSGGDATGDMFYRTSSGFWNRLPIGSTGDALTVSGGLPAWETLPSLSWDNTSGFDSLVYDEGTVLRIKSINFDFGTTYGTDITDTTINVRIDTTASGVISDNTYTPTKTDGSNVASSSFTDFNYTRVGNIFTVWGEFTVTGTSALTLTTIDFTLPISCLLTNSYDLSGTATSNDNSNFRISANTSSNRMTASGIIQTTSATTFSFMFTYKQVDP